MKLSMTNYRRPRPVWLMVVGDTFIYAGTTITGMAIFANNDTMAYISLGSSVLGYFFSRLWTATNNEMEKEEAA